MADRTRRKREVAILVRLSNEEHDRLKWVADALGFGISETLRSLIPNVRLPDREVVKTNAEIAAAAPFDRVPVNEEIDVEELCNLLDQIGTLRAALTLAREIRQQVLERGERTLTVATYKRLGRWCHPYRWTKREEDIQPLAKRISELLFGQVIERIA